ncbi:hypothetical protein DSECCO2_492120 [anaerobic digester metagenome]
MPPVNRELKDPVAPVLGPDKQFSVPEPVLVLNFIEQFQERASPESLETALVVIKF